MIPAANRLDKYVSLIYDAGSYMKPFQDLLSTRTYICSVNDVFNIGLKTWDSELAHSFVVCLPPD